MLARIPRPIRSRLGPILLALLIALPTGFLLGGASAHPAGAAPVGHRMASVGPAAPHPQAIGCTPTYPVYTFVNGLDPPTPNFAHQSPCTLAAAGHDEIHGSFSSQLANSSDHVIFPVHLPKDGSSSVVGLFDDLFIGMVVTGETRSIYNESWAELVFKPVSVASGVNYTVKIAVWSVLTNASAGACALGMNFTWSMGYACEIDNDLNGSKVLAKEVKGGDFVNVTFVGTNLTGHALTIYLNDSTAGFSESQSLSKANTGYGTHPGNATFSPAWSAACPDDCRLNWSFPFGLALGYDLCDNPPACTSFNNTTMAGSSSAVWFAPHFWTGSGYNGDYHFFSPQSDTGACSNAGGGLLIPCTTDMIDGTYPFFTFNGSALLFGPTWNGTTVTWGGAHQEFDALGTANDSIPFFLQRVTNSSLGGYLAPGNPLSVSARVEDLGNATTVLLNYTAPGGTEQSVAMGRISGTAEDGVYNYTIPAPAQNGKLTYRIFAGSRAANSLDSPSLRHAPSEVTIGPLPHFRIWLNTTYSSCGGILMNGTVWPDLTQLTVLPGTYPIVGVTCYKYAFRTWASSGGLSAWPSSPYSTLTVTASGSLTLVDQYVRPNDSLALNWNVGTPCGTIVFNGNAYASPTVLSVPDNATYSLTYTGCPNYGFSGWTVDNPLIAINNSEVYIGSNGTITSNWVPSVTSTALLLQVSPAFTGGILFQGAAYPDNTTLYLTQGQQYNIHQFPYGGFGFSRWIVSGSVTLGAGQVTVNGPGTVTAVDYALTIVRLSVSPPAGGTVLFDNVLYKDGARINVTNNSANSVFPHAAVGYTYVSMGGTPVTNLTVVNGNTLIVNGSGTLTVNFEKGSGSAFIEFQTDPSTCGSIEFNGVNYTNSQYTEVPPGLSVGVAPFPCAGFGFVKWLTSGGVSVSGSTANVSTIGGTLEAVYHQLALVRVYTAPVSCGRIVLNGVSYASGAQLELPIYAWTTLTQLPCGDYHFTGWINTTGSLINSTAIYIIGPTLLTALYGRNTYSVLVDVAPATCGGLKVSTLTVFNNTTLVLTTGAYVLSPQPCPTFELLGYNASGNLSVANGSMTIRGAGALTVNYGPVPPTLTITVPSTSYAGDSALLSAQVALPVVPFNGYRYDWSFGDGSSLVTALNTTNHVFANTGSYTVSVKVIDPYGRTASASAPISVVKAPPVSNALPVAGFAVIGVVAVLLLLGLAVGLRRRSQARRPPTDSLPPPNAQEPSALPSGASSTPALPPNQETDAAEPPP